MKHASPLALGDGQAKRQAKRHAKRPEINDWRDARWTKAES